MERVGLVMRSVIPLRAAIGFCSWAGGATSPVWTMSVRSPRLDRQAPAIARRNIVLLDVSARSAGA